MNLRYRNERAPSSTSEASGLFLPAWNASCTIKVDKEQLNFCLHCLASQKAT